jgi:hypothetical protein
MAQATIFPILSNCTHHLLNSKLAINKLLKESQLEAI